MHALLDNLSLATRLLGAPISPNALAAQVTRCRDGRIDLHSVIEVMRSVGFDIHLVQRKLESIAAEATPVLLMMTDEKIKVVDSIRTRGALRIYSIRSLDGTVEECTAAELEKDYIDYCWFIKPHGSADHRSELPEYTLPKAWFWKVMWRFKSYYIQVVIASIVINALAVVTSLYTMNVYDRVIPNKSYDTLWVMSIGVLISIALELLARTIRGALTDIAGKKADLIISSALFRRAMALDLVEKPASSGSYANNLRDFESVRDFMTSATLLALVDLPFTLFFVAIIGMVAGPLMWVPLLIMPVVLAVGLLAQIPLAKYTEESMKESSQRQGLAVEAIEGLETLKANNATNWAQERWERYTATASSASIKMRNISNLVVNFAMSLQQANTVVLIVWGTYLIHGDNPATNITMGALIAAVILSGRALAPLSQVAGLSIRVQQTMVALRGIDAISQRKTDRDPGRTYLSINKSEGAIVFNNVSFAYPRSANPCLKGISFAVKPGEKVAIIGRIGSGKSTTLRLAAGLYGPKEGVVTLDGVELRQIDPTDLRHQVTLLSQAPRLFLGSLRENLEMGRMDDFGNDEELVAALRRFRVDHIIKGHPRGLDMMIGEDGQGLSGGQKQIIGLARLTLHNPSVVLLDEPTSGLDQGSEIEALKGIQDWAQDRTLIVVTHRPQVLDIVSRIIVIDGGKIVLDGPKAQVLQTLAQGAQAAAPAAVPAGAAPVASIARAT